MVSAEGRILATARVHCRSGVGRMRLSAQPQKKPLSEPCRVLALHSLLIPALSFFVLLITGSFVPSYLLIDQRRAVNRAALTSD
jgi:hypothetical protein